MITCKGCRVEVKEVYVKFLYHCYIDTENESREIFTTQSALVWAIFETFLADLTAALLSSSSHNSSAATQSSSSLHVDTPYAAGASHPFASTSNRARLDLLRSYVSDDVVRVLIGYFGHNLFNHIQAPHVRELNFINKRNLKLTLLISKQTCIFFFFTQSSSRLFSKHSTQK